MKKKVIKYGLFLCVLGLLVGVLLAVVNGITKPEIDKLNAEKFQNMIEEFSPEYEYKEKDVALLDNVLAAYILTPKEDSKLSENVYLYKTKGNGYGNGEIDTMVFIQNGKILKVSIVSMDGQTKGVGTKVEKDSYLAKYENVSVTSYAGIKASSHNNKSTDVISGATYSSRGVIEGVIAACNQYLKDTASEVNE